MDNSGIFITEVGASVPTAADYQYVFNSNWPSLQCAFDSLTSLSPGGSATLAHNLGFYPFTLGWLLQNGVSMGRIFAFSENFEGYQTNVTMTFDKTNVYLTNNDTVTWSVNVKCYNLDITTQANYTLPQFPAAKQPYDNSVGIKVTKFNKQITSHDLRDFILHSRAQSPAVLAVVTQASTLLPGATQGVIAYLNPANTAYTGTTALPYIPWAFAFVFSGSTYYGLAPGFQQSGAEFQLDQNINGAFGITVSGNGAVLTSTNPSSFVGSLVVLRDPLLVASATEFIYEGTPG
jgi:hypothetical protein